MEYPAAVGKTVGKSRAPASHEPAAPRRTTGAPLRVQGPLAAGAVARQISQPCGSGESAPAKYMLQPSASSRTLAGMAPGLPRPSDRPASELSGTSVQAIPSSDVR